MPTKKFFLVIVSALMAVALFAGCSSGGSSYDKNVLTVREGTMNMNPSVPIGKAFDQFFVNGKWKSFTSTENELIVEFNGECTWYNKPADMKVQFVLSGNEFSLKYIGINGFDMNYFDSLEILEKVLSEYRP